MKKEIKKGKLLSYEIKSDAPLLGSFEHNRNPVQHLEYFLEKTFENGYPEPNPYPFVIEKTLIRDATIIE